LRQAPEADQRRPAARLGRLAAGPLPPRAPPPPRLRRAHAPPARLPEAPYRLPDRRPPEAVEVPARLRLAGHDRRLLPRRPARLTRPGALVLRRPRGAGLPRPRPRSPVRGLCRERPAF